jgi:hypothetical protein
MSIEAVVQPGWTVGVRGVLLISENVLNSDLSGTPFGMFTKRREPEARGLVEGNARSDSS